MRGGNISPPIEVVEYSRDEGSTTEPDVAEITFDGVNRNNLSENPRTFATEDGVVVYVGDLGDVYIDEDHVHVAEHLYHTNRLVMVREYVAEIILNLAEDGIVEGITVSDRSRDTENTK